MMADSLFDPFGVLPGLDIVVESWDDLRSESAGTTVAPFGRPDPIVITSMRPYPSGSLNFYTLTLEDRDTALNLIRTGEIIGFSPEFPEYGLPMPTHLNVRKVNVERVVNRGSAAGRFWSLDVQIVDAPEIPPVKEVGF